MGCKNKENQSGVSTKELIIGGIVGGTVGAFAALMFAPKSGQEFRKDLQSKEVINKSVGMAKTVGNQLSSQSSSLVSKAKEVAQSIKKEDEPFS
ncbi:YtxH domain-containing protein [Terrilactibacillus laevilacticus]|uniref:YtxH domain-containing protein n=1 Tax=Terrilactibacillus laevilacticus TaxID=1380157 RepID=A0ABW5PQD5_9BACI|nr:YtxH domain-containing protein [Terrilactibacillus laevilacticus]